MADHNNTFYLLELDNALALNYCKTSSEYNNIVFSYMGINKKWQKTLLKVSFPMIKLLLVLGSTLFVTVKCIVSFFRCLCTKRETPISGRKYFFFFLPLFYGRCKAAGIYNDSEYWIPGANITDLRPYNLEGKIIVDYFKYLYVADCFKALWKCYMTIGSYLINVNCFYAVYKTWNYYSAFEAISRMSQGCDIYFGNQSDRWAIMFDRIQCRKHILVQHGVASTKVICPARLSNVNILYAISNNTWQDMFTSILDCTPELHFMKSTLTLSEIEYVGVPSVLIVSHINFFEHEKKLVEWLYKSGNYNVFLKKHPEVKNDICYRELENKYGFHYITDAWFPRVDGVISYLSTLAYEYMSADVPVFIYEPTDGLNYIDLYDFLNNLNKTQINDFKR